MSGPGDETILTERLSRMIANLDAYITRRGAELAEEHIKAADEDCAQRIAAAEFETQRRDGLITELRRRIAALERQLELERAPVGQGGAR